MAVSPASPGLGAAFLWNETTAVSPATAAKSSMLAGMCMLKSVKL